MESWSGWTGSLRCVYVYVCVCVSAHVRVGMNECAHVSEELISMGMKKFVNGVLVIAACQLKTYFSLLTGFHKEYNIVIENLSFEYHWLMCC